MAAVGYVVLFAGGAVDPSEAGPEIEYEGGVSLPAGGLTGQGRAQLATDRLVQLGDGVVQHGSDGAGGNEVGNEAAWVGGGCIAEQTGHTRGCGQQDHSAHLFPALSFSPLRTLSFLSANAFLSCTYW